MTVQALKESPRLDDATYQAKLESVRAYVAQLEHADQDADKDSLTRAADLAAIYEDKRWMDDMPEPETSRRPTAFRIVPDSREQFYKWAKEHVTSPTTDQPLQKATAKSLLSTADVLRSMVDPSTMERSGIGHSGLRPLFKLISDGRNDEVVEVWRRAVKLAEAEGLEAPGRAIVKRALADHNKALGIKASISRRTVSTYESKVEHEFDWLVRHSSPEQNAALLKRLADRLRQEHRWAKGEEWSA